MKPDKAVEPEHIADTGKMVKGTQKKHLTSGKSVQDPTTYAKHIAKKELNWTPVKPHLMSNTNKAEEIFNNLCSLISTERDAKELHGYKVIKEEVFKEWFASQFAPTPQPTDNSFEEEAAELIEKLDQFIYDVTLPLALNGTEVSKQPLYDLKRFLTSFGKTTSLERDNRVELEKTIESYKIFHNYLFGCDLNANDFFYYATAMGVSINDSDIDWMIEMAKKYGSDGISAATAYIQNQQPIKPRQTRQFELAIKELMESNQEVYSDCDHSHTYNHSEEVYRKVKTD